MACVMRWTRAATNEHFSILESKTPAQAGVLNRSHSGLDENPSTGDILQVVRPQVIVALLNSRFQFIQRKRRVQLSTQSNGIFAALNTFAQHIIATQPSQKCSSIFDRH